MANNASLVFAEVRAATPAGVSPFLAIEAVITAAVYPKMPESFYYQLYIPSAIFCLYVALARR